MIVAGSMSLLGLSGALGYLYYSYSSKFYADSKIYTDEKMVKASEYLLKHSFIAFSKLCKDASFYYQRHPEELQKI